MIIKLVAYCCMLHVTWRCSCGYPAQHGFATYIVTCSMLHTNRLTANIPSEILSLDGLRELYAHHCIIQRTCAPLATGGLGISCAVRATRRVVRARSGSGILPGSISCCHCRAGYETLGIPSLAGCPIRTPRPPFFFRQVYIRQQLLVGRVAHSREDHEDAVDRASASV